MGMESRNRHLLPFLSYSYVWINVKKITFYEYNDFKVKEISIRISAQSY